MQPWALGSVSTCDLQGPELQSVQSKCDFLRNLECLDLEWVTALLLRAEPTRSAEAASRGAAMQSW